MKVVVLTREGLQGMSLCGIERRSKRCKPCCEAVVGLVEVDFIHSNEEAANHFEGKEWTVGKG